MPEISPSRYLIQCGWNDVPHLSEKAKTELYNSAQPHTREARKTGEPFIGAGAIYPVSWEDVSVKPFKIPPYWPKGYGLDVGWKKTCAIWGAHDRDTDTIYLYTEHYRGYASPVIHAASIRARGEWIPGAIDPAARGRSQKDGEQLLANYQAEKLILMPAVNAVEAGLHECFNRLTTGRLKIFSTMQNLKAELKLYRRDEKGQIVKKFDHAMDAMRYLVMTRMIMRVEPQLSRMGNVELGVADLRAGY